MKKLFTISAILLVSTSVFGQSAESVAILDDPLILFYITAGFLFVVSLLVIAVALYMLQVLRHMAKNAAMERAEKKGVVYKEEPSLLFKLNQWLSDSVPIEKEETIMLDHNYDGIRELDNHLPPWWKWLLYGSIVWGVAYMFVYHVSNSLPLSIEEYNNEVAYADEEIRKMQASNSGTKIDESTVVFTEEPVALADGQQTFNSICASCHRVDGGGDIGPNLTDQYWKNGGTIAEIFKVVKEGVPNTNMVAWGAALSPEKIQNVSSYILTMQGSNPPNPKAPEGELFKPQPQEEIPSDTTSAQASL